MRHIDKIIIHCSATPPDRHIGADEIRLWHIRDKGWTDIGYHSVIRRDGAVEAGRGLELPGAHTAGHNGSSIGVCLVGGVDDKGLPANNFTPEQWATLARLLCELTGRFSGAKVFGHRDFARKDCPCFDVSAWWEDIREECG